VPRGTGPYIHESGASYAGHAVHELNLGAEAHERGHRLRQMSRENKCGNRYKSIDRGKPHP
jgi:hypothetical protein